MAGFFSFKLLVDSTSRKQSLYYGDPGSEGEYKLYLFQQPLEILHRDAENCTPCVFVKCG